VSFYDIDDARVPVYIALFAVSNFLGPVLLGRLFDTVGRKPMIAGSYLGSAAVLCLLTILFLGGSLGVWGFMARLLATFFLASAGASSAYLTVSEIFPMETRALAIAFFYANFCWVGERRGRRECVHFVALATPTPIGATFRTSTVHFVALTPVRRTIAAKCTLTRPTSRS
jgi:hypothetical protein